ncbi:MULTISPECIES: hypothetical protein [unclassified Mucilaginibacter]|uniref:hypothetical protein n=1 Tax=unclassified Mucilaginibacter TaxID=2617802 RepID=UPI002AC93815|nr:MULTISPECIES: hypothetical protein [unclassified Mucilaginibacter]MEB0260500.1 hypothetical protein [Mucilaginibacter sp. 10I4]MEB0280082.1 hypothetical protein [Mucilaginibacter sp. 10B2]MEB0303017.1 hypothetical protein [Mucilaginibacter sp. 5C4]WPX23577.1 hypothetical protein RHM67_20090 [Mucilaginibacter sp. 5C4]
MPDNYTYTYTFTGIINYWKLIITTNVINIMDYNVYLLATDPNNPCRDVIHSRDTGLKIRVYCLTEDRFTPSESEIQLYGYANARLYAFETINITADDALDVVGAIQWYADYIEFPKMEILPEDPRGSQNIAM